MFPGPPGPPQAPQGPTWAPWGDHWSAGEVKLQTRSIAAWPSTPNTGLAAEAPATQDGEYVKNVHGKKVKGAVGG